MLAASFTKYQERGKSIEDISAFLNSEYQIDFNKEYKNIKGKLHVTKNKSANTRLETIDVIEVQAVLDANGVVAGTETYNYLTNLSNLFEDGLLSEDQVYVEIGNLKNQIQNNYIMTYYEKENLLAVTEAIQSNFSGIVNVVYANEQYYSVRSKGWFTKAWRIVRSVILTAAVGAVIGFYAGGVPGTIVGAIVMGVVAITDAAANDHCHFAMQCDGGWRQDCTDGICLPY